MDNEENEYAGFSPSGEEKQNVHTFLHDVAVTPDTTKVSNLSIEELGNPKLPLRTHKELELFCRDILSQKEFANYFQKKGEILTSTALSKDAKLIDLAVVQRREIGEISKAPLKENKGWFKKRQRGGDLNQQSPLI